MEEVTEMVKGFSVDVLGMLLLFMDFRKPSWSLMN